MSICLKCKLWKVSRYIILSYKVIAYLYFTTDMKNAFVILGKLRL